MGVLDAALAMLDETATIAVRGRVTRVNGLAVQVAQLPAPIGAAVRVATDGGRAALRGEVVGFQGDQSTVMLYGSASGVRPGDAVLVTQNRQQVNVGDAMLGRVVDAMGMPMDGGGPIHDVTPRALEPEPIDAMQRPLIETPLATGVRAIDAMLSVGRGQRLGVFAAPGVGKSTLLGMMARRTAADVIVIGLVGERGREVRDFCESVLGPKDRKRSVVVAATGDEPPLMRLRAAMTATAVAEYFRDQGKDVLLIMDSVTRFCQAQRQIGLASGELPATRGYPPSVFAMVPRLLERSGRTAAGSITAFYSILVEGDDMDEPISDACRGVLDGHVLLSRKLASRGHYPAIDILGSISRVAPDVTDGTHQQACRTVQRILADYEKVEDLVNIGAYQNGSNPGFDVAIHCKPMVDQLLQQGRADTQQKVSFDTTRSQLLTLVQEIARHEERLQKQQKTRVNRVGEPARSRA